MRRTVLMLVVVAAVASPARAVPPAAGGALASPNVELVATIPDVAAIGARFIGDTMYVTTTGGLRIYDVSQGIPVPLGVLTLPHFENEDVDTNGEILLISADHLTSFLRSVLYVVDVRNPRAPLLMSVLPVPDGHTVSCILGCTWAWLAGSRDVYVVDLRDPAAPQPAGSFRASGSTHDVQVDETGLAWVSSGAGLAAYRPRADLPSMPTKVAEVRNGVPGSFDNDFIIHNSLRPQAGLATSQKMDDGVVDDGEVLLVTEEDWLSAPGTSSGNGGCSNDGSFQTGWYHTVGGVPVVERLDTFQLGQGTVAADTDRKPTAAVACSSHYFDIQDDVVAVAWYEQGVRFLDVSNPARIRQIGYYMPALTEAWSAQIHGEYTYVLDVARGIDVLRFTGVAGASATYMAPRLNPTPPVSAPSARWGYACRIPA